MDYRRLGAEDGMTPERITQKQAMVYEVAASWWASWVFIALMQEMTSSYFAWKVRRKWKRYVATLEMCERVKNGPRC